MSYCSSEIGGGDSEIYSPYSFYSSEAGADVALGDPQDGWSTPTNAKQRTGKSVNRLRMRKGRSIVHKNLEDNYGAVIVANHEALVQVLEQVRVFPFYLFDVKKFKKPNYHKNSIKICEKIKINHI